MLQIKGMLYTDQGHLGERGSFWKQEVVEVTAVGQAQRGRSGEVARRKDTKAGTGLEWPYETSPQA